MPRPAPWNCRLFKKKQLMKASFPLNPGATLGLMGGGQLGRMFAQAAATLGYEVEVLEKGSCPASEVWPTVPTAA